MLCKNVQVSLLVWLACSCTMLLKGTQCVYLCSEMANHFYVIHSLCYVLLRSVLHNVFFLTCSFLTLSSLDDVSSPDCSGERFLFCFHLFVFKGNTVQKKYWNTDGFTCYFRLEKVLAVLRCSTVCNSCLLPDDKGCCDLFLDCKHLVCCLLWARERWYRYYCWSCATKERSGEMYGHLGVFFLCLLGLGVI